MTKTTALRPLAVNRYGVAGRLAVVAACLALTLPFASSALAQAGLGDPAPDFTLTGNDDVSYTLSDAFTSQVQMLYFIGYSWGSCINDGPSVEAIHQMFDPSVLRSFSLDVWNGSDAQNDLFQTLSETSFPVLLNASGLQAGDQYDTGRHTVFVIDGDGIVRYRGSVNSALITAAVEEAVADLGGEVAVGDVPGSAALLGANYPNPFNPSTNIPFEVPVANDGSRVTIDVLDLRGRVVRTLMAESRPAGQHVVPFNGLDQRGNQLPSGSYLARMRVDGLETSRIMTLVK